MQHNSGAGLTGRFRFLAVWFSGFVLGAMTAPLQASENDPYFETLPPVSISSTRSYNLPEDIPAPVSILDRYRIQNGRPAITLDESLNSIPGLFIQNQFNYAQDLRISIRGFGARSPFGVRGVKVLVDDIPQTMPDGQTQLDSIDPAIIESIQILRGPSSSLYGNSSGGVISITTQDGTSEGVEIKPHLFFGEFGSQKYQLKVGGRSHRVNYHLYATYFNRDGFREHSAARHSLFHGKFIYQVDSNSDWTWTLNHFDSPFALDPGALTKAESDSNPEQASANNLLFSAGEEVGEQNLGLRYRKKRAEGHEISLTAHLNRRDFSNLLAFNSGGRVEFERLAPGLGLKSVLDHKIFSRPNRFISGLDVSSQFDNRKRFNNDFGVKGDKTLDQIESVFNMAPYLRDELKLTSRIGLIGGIRYDYFYYDLEDTFKDDGDQSDNRTLLEVSGTLGAVFHLDRSHHIYANFSTVFEVPTTTEMINKPSGDPGFNSNLEAQKSFNYEIGFKGRENTGFRYELAVFFIQSEDELVSFEVPGASGRNFFLNAGKSERVGVEAQGGYRFLEVMEFSLGYTYSDFEFTDFFYSGVDLAGKDIPGNPTHRLTWGMDMAFDQSWYSRLEFQFVGEYFVDNANTVTNPEYIASQFVIGREGDLGPFRVSVFIGLNNLLNETYNANTRINAGGDRFFEPAPSFNIFGGVSLNYRLPDTSLN